ncbi:ribonuclease 3-like protein 1 [Prosopis cineraria]|uniref:ribonuclease 3-like protein 1 n=1 Tax=Prosopis cineraria TaxID=364024 RepID=UPI0024101175|nr:ribonuclease 3-like protein 1 [Prosopis cineraria]
MDVQGHEESKMENNFSQPENSVINLKQLPPIDPSTIVNSSFNGKSRQSGAGSAHKNVKPNFNRGLKSFKSVQALRKSNSGSISSGKTSETPWNTTSDSNSADDGMKQGSARSNLYEVCAANHWKPPAFDCCKEEGPSHQKIFTFKVIIEIEAGMKTTIECFGSPHQKKKTAADHAAEGALWFLKHQGHVRKKKNQ